MMTLRRNSSAISPRAFASSRLRSKSRRLRSFQIAVSVRSSSMNACRAASFRSIASFLRRMAACCARRMASVCCLNSACFVSLSFSARCFPIRSALSCSSIRRRLSSFSLKRSSSSRCVCFCRRSASPRFSWSRSCTCRCRWCSCAARSRTRSRSNAADRCTFSAMIACRCSSRSRANSIAVACFSARRSITSRRCASSSRTAAVDTSNPKPG
mmetsp:Transcript_7112/g.11142  ORF Transcript_7112/g.11142 Transcript_7112/m.11142 type:complete len:213 (+) Transcript_7112:836-1474(+)